MYTIENLTAQTYLIYASDFMVARILPGINLNVPDEIYLTIQAREHLRLLFDSGLFALHSGLDKKVFTDDETDITFIDDSGEKVPIMNTSVNNSSSMLTTHKVFKSQELKALGFPASLISKVVSQCPESGWKNATQVIEAFELSGRNADLVVKLDFNN